MAVDASALSLADIRAAAERIRPFILPTPLLSAEAFQKDLWIKAESLQRTGSFKIRGAMNAVLQLTEEQRRRGVITLSAGNHGKALAYAARTAGLPCVVVIREDAPQSKVGAIRDYGAEIVLVALDQWQERLEEEQRNRGLQLVHPFDDAAVIAGQGTVGLEMLHTSPALRTVIVPVGGGGLIAGIALALKEERPDIQLIGVEPSHAAVVSESLTAGRPVKPSSLDSIADGLAAPYTRPLNLGLIRRYVDDMITVSDEAIVEALRVIALQLKLVVEPAGAAGMAALLQGCSINRPAAVVLTGGNVDAKRFAAWIS
jgi:threonine dehydratase